MYTLHNDQVIIASCHTTPIFPNDTNTNSIDHNNTHLIEFTVNIDFDAAQEAWRRNKKQIPGGGFKYICGCSRSCNNNAPKRHVKSSVSSSSTTLFCKKPCYKHSQKYVRQPSMMPDLFLPGMWSECWYHNKDSSSQ